MDLLRTTRYPSRGLSSDATDPSDPAAPSAAERVAGPVSIDGLEVVDEQVVPLAPLDGPGRRRPRTDRAVG